MSDLDATFHALVGELDYPMFIVTVAVNEERAGCLVGFTTQTSVDPLRFLVCLSQRNRTYELAAHAAALGVHVVPADAPDLAQLFGGESGDEVDKFAHSRWHTGPEEVPILDRCEKWFVGRVLERWEAGDHDAFLLEPIAAMAGTAPGDFSSRRAQGIAPGHAP